MAKASQKIIVILGPTASGKSDLAIQIAKKYNGEIVSADSRQVYRRMDIGTGKIARDFSVPSSKRKTQSSKLRNGDYFISNGIRHHMLDIVSPNTDYNVAKFKKAAEKCIKDIISHRKMPIICGGTGFWISAMVDNKNFPAVLPDWNLRKKLAKFSAVKLYEKLKKFDPERAKNIDKNNKVRLIRAIEICHSIGKVPKQNYDLGFKNLPASRQGYKFLQIGVNLPKEKLYRNIRIRLDKRFKQGMIKEVKDLHEKYGVSWKRLELFGLEYRWIAKYLHPVKYHEVVSISSEFNRVKNKLSLQDMKLRLYQEIKNYAKRQMTWFKKDSRIQWVKNKKEASKLVANFLRK